MERSELENRIRAFFASPKVAALATVTGEGKPWVRYVTVRATGDLTLRIVTDAASRKVAEIRSHPDVHLTCGNLKPPDDSVYMQIAGLAAMSTDPGEKRELWNDEYRRYFQGSDDPNYVVIRVLPDLIEYTGPDSPKPSVWRR
jgi:general stress protein 26